MSYIAEYYKEVEEGNIIVGQELYTQLKIVYLETNDPIYQNLHGIKVDFEDSNKRINFIEKNVNTLKLHMQGSLLY